MHRAIAYTLTLLTATAARAGDAAVTDQGPWWLGPLVTILAAAIGALAIVAQLGRQHRNESERQTEHFKVQLRLQVYQEFSGRLSTAADALGRTSMYAFTIPTHVEIFTSQVAKGFNPTPITDRALRFLQVNSEASSEVIEAVFLVEKYFIVHPDLDIFRMALSAGSHDLSKAFHPLFEFMLAHLPMDVQSAEEERVDNVKVLSPAELLQLKDLTDTYYNAAMDLDCYLSDMRTELQTLLLSYLFPNTLPRRRPADPSKKVISLEPAAVNSLRQHFLKNTAWGKSAVNTQLSVHREFHGRA